MLHFYRILPTIKTILTSSKIDVSYALENVQTKEKTMGLLAIIKKYFSQEDLPVSFTAGHERILRKECDSVDVKSNPTTNLVTIYGYRKGKRIVHCITTDEVYKELCDKGLTEEGLTADIARSARMPNTDHNASVPKPDHSLSILRMPRLVLTTSLLNVFSRK